VGLWTTKRLRVCGGSGNGHQNRSQQDQGTERVEEKCDACGGGRDDDTAQDRPDDVEREGGIQPEQPVDGEPPGVAGHGRRQEAPAARSSHPEGGTEEQTGNQDRQCQLARDCQEAKCGERQRPQQTVGDQERSGRHSDPSQSDRQRKDRGENERRRVDQPDGDGLRHASMDRKGLHGHRHYEHSRAGVGQQITEQKTSDLPVP
jgi:hypothetical protein